MKDGGRIALALAAGYLLGRTHKLRFALMLIIAGVTGRIAKNPSGLVKQGTKLLGSSAEVKTLTDTVRGRLVEAGKTAAVNVASNQIDALSDRLQERARSLRHPPRPGGEEPGAEEEPRARRRRADEDEEERPRRRAPEEESWEERGAEEEPRARRRRADEDEEDEEDGEERPMRRSAERGRPGPARRSGGREDDPEDRESERRRPIRSGEPGRSPVRRTQR